MTLHGFISKIGYLGIPADIFEVSADEAGELLFASFLYFVYFFDSSFVGKTASQTINRIGWINGDSPVLKDFGNFFDQSCLGVLTVY